MYSSFNWSVKTDTEKNYHKTYKINGMYHHSNGSTYYSLYGGKSGKWYGYINADAVKVTKNKQGSVYGNKVYATVTKKYDAWGSFNWIKKTPASKAYEKTYEVKYQYSYCDGRTFYSIYGGKSGKWYGYINAAGVKTTESKEGVELPATGYATVTKKYDSWASFDWNKYRSGVENYQQTYLIGHKYSYSDGRTFYETWYYNPSFHNWYFAGYINAAGVKVTQNPQGIALKASGYTTIKTGQIDSNFAGKIAIDNNHAHEKTYKVNYFYNHSDGTKYYSLYDDKNRWVGYIDATKTTPSNNPQGIDFNSEDTVKVVKQGYPIYSNWDLTTQAINASNAYNQIYQTKYYNNHVNGKKYYQLYDINNSNKFIGYIDANAVQTDFSLLEANLGKSGLPAWNTYRKSKGLNTLNGPIALQRAVDLRAKELEQLFDHIRPNGGDWGDVAHDEFGYTGLVCNENIMWADFTSLNSIKTTGVTRAMTAWKNSSGHNANLLAKGMNDGAMGFHIKKYSNNNYRLYAVTQGAYAH